MKRLRKWIESIVFAGLRPAGSQTQSRRRFKRIRQPVERLLSGGPAPTDPLYLTNRSMGRKIRSWAVIGVPLLLLTIGIGIALSTLLEPQSAKPVKELTPAEVAARMLPNMAKDIHIPGNKDLELVEVRVVRQGDAPRLVGIVRNKGNRELGAELIFDLTDVKGSQVGSVSSFAEKIPPLQTKQFETVLKQTDAASALVREIISR